MRFKSRWTGLILLVTIVMLTVAPHSRSQLSAPFPLAISQRVIPPSLFGMHIHYGGKTWPNVPFATWRLWDTYTTWGDLEPQPGVWNFELLDQYVKRAAKQKVEIVLTLGQTPRWAAARPNDPSPYGNPGWPSEPKNMQDWRNYIRTVATRYRGQIRYYEIWNEPDLKQFYTGSIDKMVELSREAYKILKQVDPKIVVLSPATTDATPDLRWQKNFWQKGGGKYADVIAQHFYPPTETAIPEDLAKYIHRLKALMAQSGLAKKPLWNTESGWLKPAKIESDRQAMAYLARMYLINWASGVQRFYWYAWDNRDAVSLYLTASDRQTPTPIAKSYAQIQKWMVGAQMEECGINASKTWICRLRRSGKPVWIVWNPDRRLTFTVPKNWRVRTVQDLSGKNQTLPNSRQINIDYLPVLLSKNTSP